MSVYLGYDTVTKQYLKGLTGGGGASTMSGDIDMDGNEIVGLDDPSNDSSAASKKYVDNEVAKVGGTVDIRYLRKTDAVSTYETQTDASNTYLSKTDVTSTL